MARSAVERGREARARLLAAAAELIPELGWGAVSTRAIAARAGVTVGAVHYHFPSVQALLRQAVVGVLRDLLDAVEPLVAQADSPEVAIAVMLGPLTEHAEDNRGSLLFVEAYLASARDEDLRAQLVALLAEFRGIVTGWLDRAGYAHTDDTASVLAAAVDGVLLHRLLNPRLQPAAAVPVLVKLLGGPSTSAADGMSAADTGA